MNPLHRNRPLSRAMRASLLILGLALGGTAGAASTLLLEHDVSFADLNVHSAAGMATLDRRLRSAAALVCKPLESRMLPVHAAWKHCVSKSLAAAAVDLQTGQVAVAVIDAGPRRRCGGLMSSPFPARGDARHAGGEERTAMSRDTGSSSIDGGEYAQARAVRAQPQWGLLGFEHERLAAVVPVRDGPVRVGRDADCDLRFQDGSVSRLHCTLSLIGDAVQVRDAGSLNGIFRAGVRLDAALLGEGDELSLGNAFVKLVDLRRPAWTIHERLHDELYRDAATGLSNRRSFQRKSEAAVASLRPDQPLGAVHIEAAGDRAAREEHIAVLGGILRKLQRTGLFAAHFGEGPLRLSVVGCIAGCAAPLRGCRAERGRCRPRCLRQVRDHYRRRIGNRSAVGFDAAVRRRRRLPDRTRGTAQVLSAGAARCRRIATPFAAGRAARTFRAAAVKAESTTGGPRAARRGKRCAALRTGGAPPRCRSGRTTDRAAIAKVRSSAGIVIARRGAPTPPVTVTRVAACALAGVGSPVAEVVLPVTLLPPTAAAVAVTVTVMPSKPPLSAFGEIDRAAVPRCPPARSGAAGESGTSTSSKAAALAGAT